MTIQLPQKAADAIPAIATQPDLEQTSSSGQRWGRCLSRTGRTVHQTLPRVERSPPASTTNLINRLAVPQPSAAAATNASKSVTTSKAAAPPDIVNNLKITFSNGGTATLQEILDRKPELINQPVMLKSKKDTTLLHMTAYHGYLNATQTLLTKGANKDAKDFCGLTPLHVATARHHSSVVELLVSSNANLEATDNKGRTPLHVAARLNCSKIASYLMEQGENADATMHDGSTPLHVAATHGSSNVAKCLIEQGANTNAKRTDDSTPMHLAAIHGRLKITKYLIEHNANINEKRLDGSTPLQLAKLCKPSLPETLIPDSQKTFTDRKRERKHYSKIIKKLKDCQQSKSGESNSSYPNPTRQGFLFRTFRSRQERGAEHTEMRVIEKIPRESTSAPHPQQHDSSTTTFSPQPSTSQLTSAGSQISCQPEEAASSLPIVPATAASTNRSIHRDECKVHPLLIACREGDETEAMNILNQKPELINQQFPPDTKSNLLITPLIMASYCNQVTLVERLLKMKASIHETMNTHHTALHIAAQRGHPGVVGLLVTNASDIDAKTDTGFTALHIAAYKGHLSVVKLLVELGAKIHEKTNNNDTALDLSKSNNNKEITTFLKTSAKEKDTSHSRQRQTGLLHAITKRLQGTRTGKDSVQTEMRVMEEQQPFLAEERPPLQANEARRNSLRIKHFT
nr:ankyrin repeat domain-containing protein [Endozoicomonas sp.]